MANQKGRVVQSDIDGSPDGSDDASRRLMIDALKSTLAETRVEVCIRFVLIHIFGFVAHMEGLHFSLVKVEPNGPSTRGPRQSTCTNVRLYWYLRILPLLTGLCT